MAKNIFEMSKDGKSEYSISVVKIQRLIPIEGSDFLAQTFIGDASIVVRKDMVREGDILFYASNESQLNEKFLSVNNLFEKGCYEKNSNHEEVSKLLAESKVFEECASNMIGEKKEEFLLKRDELQSKTKAMCGFFSHSGRVRMIRLKKTPSMGYLFSKEEMVKFCPKVKAINMEDYLNVDFDTVDGELFVKAYVPPIKECKSHGAKNLKRNKKLKHFDRMVPGEFSFHYDTSMLSKNIHRINPNDVVTISVKCHGTSGIFGNILMKKPLKIPFYKRWWNKFVDTTKIFNDLRITDYVIEYDNVYSSRSVIKNQFINKDANSGYYKYDIWKEANEVLKPYIKEGMTIYCEICGWAGKTMIQKGFDYRCKQGEFFIMPYRINTKYDGEHYEWNVNEVREWTENLIRKVPELAELVHPIKILYHGTLSDLYPHVEKSMHWQENILQEMMNDKTHFGMEEYEPLCENKCYREGIVLRIDNDPINEAFKLKCKNFLYAESSNLDKNGPDIEMSQEY